MVYLLSVVILVAHCIAVIFLHSTVKKVNVSVNSSGAHLLLPGGNRGAFAHVGSPGGGAFAILWRPRGLSISVPRGDPQHLTHVFSKLGKNETFVKN